jgi:DNA-binding NarL/FixJ family response regulator
MIKSKVKKIVFSKKKANNIKLLVIDDSEFMRMIIKKVLDINGFKNVIYLSSGNDAINLVSKYNPDIVLLDINMPEIDGFETLKNIKKQNKNIKCIIISSIDQKYTVDKAYKLGATGYLKKPFDEKELINIIKKNTGIE